MIQEFPDEFTYEALESVDKFLEQREKAIQEGIYGKLQFETIDDEEIGVFSINGDEISFKKIAKTDDTSQYVFRKTPGSQAAYISPTWKAAKSNKKLESTVEDFKRYLETKGLPKESKQVFKKITKVFESKSISVEKNGKIIEKDFWSIYNGKKKSESNKSGLNVFTITIDGKYPGQIKEISDYALNQIAESFYSASGIEHIDGKCSICNHDDKLFPNVLSGTGINIANIDKPGFFPGVLKQSSLKAFPICAPCAEALFVAKSKVFPDFTQTISGHQSLIIPHLVQSDNKAEGLIVIQYALKLLARDVLSAKGAEAGIIEDLADSKGIETVSFLFGEVGGQSVHNIRKFLPDVLPSRLSEIANAIHEINRICNAYPDYHPWVLWNFKGKQKNKRNPLNGQLQIIRNVLGMAKYVKPQEGKRKPFKASSVDSLDLLESIFMKKAFPIKALIPEFSAKLSYDFLGSLSNEKQEPFFVIRDNIANMIYLLGFLNKLEVIKMADNINMVGKYLEGCKGLEPLNRFLSVEASGLDNAEKQYTFLVGLLFGKLIAFQQARRVSNNALRWLKGLEIGPQDLMEIFIKTRSKLDDYSFQRPAWSEEMKGVAEAIGALGSQIGSNWTISRKEVPYYFCLGQSLSGYYLPGKGDENKSD
ncbi:MAG: TM1802 family CRISPR-associated protein, partial [Thermodesulfovibrionales bacterium]|nr:TM1802 family CRISPR-associated protein [Thermodesulfovibrionales bacterium]